MLKKIILMLVLVGLCAGSLFAETKVLVFAGSTRQDSINKKLAQEAEQIARNLGAQVTYIDLKNFQIPLYDGDIEASGMPQKAKELRDLFIKNEVIVIASPEYNGFFSALVKNVVDWASRTEQAGASREAFKGKKFILLSASPGQSGGSRGLAQLKVLLENMGAVVVADQFVLPDSFNAFDGAGHLKNKDQFNALKKVIQSGIK